MADQYDEQVERLLPCCCQTVRDTKHYVGNRYCPADYRPAVAAKLREAEKRGMEKVIGNPMSERERRLLELLRFDLPAPEIHLEADGDLNLDWNGISVSINTSGGVNWAVLDSRHHGTSWDEIKASLAERVR